MQIIYLGLKTELSLFIIIFLSFWYIYKWKVIIYIPKCAFLMYFSRFFLSLTLSLKHFIAEQHYALGQFSMQIEWITDTHTQLLLQLLLKNIVGELICPVFLLSPISMNHIFVCLLYKNNFLVTKKKNGKSLSSSSIFIYQIQNVQATLLRIQIESTLKKKNLKRLLIN